MENSQKIWRYMDLAKFVSLLSKEALYFSCPSEFHDPFEGFIPRPWLIPAARNNETRIKDIESYRNHIANTPRYDFKDWRDELKPLDDAINGINNSLLDTISESNSKYGVNCWHKSDDESEAMWKLYSASGQGIAIESTIGQLKDSMINEENLEIEEVRYLSENSPGEYDGKMNTLAWKRKSFEHEKELRAIVSLKENGKGMFVKCDLGKLISHIHISPSSAPYYKKVIQYICSGNKLPGIDKPITQSSLFDKPDYTVKALLSPPQSRL